MWFRRVTARNVRPQWIRIGCGECRTLRGSAEGSVRSHIKFQAPWWQCGRVAAVYVAATVVSRSPSSEAAKQCVCARGPCLARLGRLLRPRVPAWYRVNCDRAALCHGDCTGRERHSSPRRHRSAAMAASPRFRNSFFFPHRRREVILSNPHARPP